MAGNWHIDHVNIAGGVVRFIFNDQHGYFPTYVSHVFAESLGSFGTFNSQLACEVSDCSIDFAYQTEAGVQNLLTSHGINVVFRSCNFRYYGANTPLLMDADCVFDHCFFSSNIVKSSSHLFVFRLPNRFFRIIPIGIVLLLVAVLVVFFKRLYSFKIFNRKKEIHNLA